MSICIWCPDMLQPWSHDRVSSNREVPKHKGFHESGPGRRDLADAASRLLWVLEVVSGRWP
eukprot:2807581-Pyramimonas_sp.AAC.2